MVTNSQIYKCNDPEYRNNIVLANDIGSRYQIPALVNNNNIEEVPFDMHDGIERNVEVTADISDGVAGRLVQVCSTECHNVTTAPVISKMSLRVLRMCYKACTLVLNPNYDPNEDITAVAPHVYDTSARQMEGWLYGGYSTTPSLAPIEGLNGFKDIAVTFQSPPNLPIDPTDYSSLCEFFVAGIDQARKGSLLSGFEYSKRDIEVHVSTQIVDKINCAILSNTAIGLWDRLLQGVLSEVRVIVSEQIGNEVYFINSRRYNGKHNSILKTLQPDIYYAKSKVEWGMLLGTITVRSQSSYPTVVYAENVISDLVVLELKQLKDQIKSVDAKKQELQYNSLEKRIKYLTAITSK
jgi:hypothetical protein